MSLTEYHYDAARDVITGSPVTPTVMSVCFEPTNRCPGRCPYCLIEKHQRQLDTAALLDVLDALLAHGTVRFGFGGGEPLLRADMFGLGRAVRHRGGGALLRTSGMFPVDREEAETAFDWIDISLDSVDEAVFRRCRPGVPYSAVTGNITELAVTGRVRVSILLTAQNASSVGATIAWLADAGVSKVRIQRLVRRGRALRHWNDMALDGALEDELVDRALAAGPRLGIEVAELTTISALTLCIVKADGSLYTGDPSGITSAGSVYRADDLAAVARRLSPAQTTAYAAR